MNKIYKTVWSKVKNTYVVVSEIAKSHSKTVSSRQRKSIAAVMTVLALGFIPGGAYAAIDGVKTFVEPGNQNVQIGNGIDLRNNSVKNGAVAIGDHAEIDDYVMQEGSIAIGKNAFVENMWGFQDKTFRFGMVTPAGDERTDPYLPAGIAIGQNTYARSGGIMLGDHKYIGKLGDTTVDSTTAEKKRRLAVLVGATTLGLNSYSAGAFATTTGAYSIMSNAYDGNTNQLSGSQNFGAVINGSFNSIESKTSGNSSSGVANAVVGTANRTFNANGALVFGAGNEIENSVGTISGIDMFMGGGDSAKDFADTLRKTVKSSNGGGAVLAIGGGNKANYAKASQLMGVNNTLTGTENTASDYNLLNGFKNVGTNISHVSVIGAENQITDTKSTVVFGNKRKLMKADGSIVLGSADDTTETNVKDAVILGHNANSTVAGGVALGSRSVADRGKADREQVYLHENDDVKATVKGDLAAISVGNDKATRQITGVAAGTADTDAVNVAQLKAMTGGGSATSVHFFSVKGSETSKNYKNDGAKDSGAIAIGANAAAEKSGSVAMGFNTTAGGSGSIAIGESAQILANEANRGDGKGTGTIIIGNESADAGGTKDHAASDDTLIGSLNSVGESNGVFVRGTGNIVTNAYHYEDLTEEDMQKFMDFFMQGKPAGEYFEKTGSHISVNGDGNYVDNALYSQISGVNNKLTGTDTLPAEYNIITGNRNTLENASNNIVTGDKYKLAGVKHAVIIGSSDEEKEVKVSDIVMVGHNANATVAGGVALGSGSVADRAGFTEKKKGVFSDVDLNGITAAAVSVGTKDKLRQIINVGDATEDTDAVNLRQLKALSTKVDNGAIHYFSVKADDSKKPAGTNWNNDGATGDNAVAIGRGASATSFSSVAIGEKALAYKGGTVSIGRNAHILGNGGNTDGEGSVAIGDNALITTNGLDLASIALGKNAKVLNGSGKQERGLSFMPDNFDKPGLFGRGNTLPKNADKVPGGIAIGTNSYARSGSIQLGHHTFAGYKMGGIDVTNANEEANIVGMTTVGTNTYNKGALANMYGAYSIITGDFTGAGGTNSWTYGPQNFGANVVGSLNSIRSKGHSGSSGVANSIVGVANTVENANGTLVYGAGNKITNSITSISADAGFTTLKNWDDTVTGLQEVIKNSKSGGAVLAIGGGNVADYVRHSQLVGVNNTVTGTENKVSEFNMVNGYQNTATNITHVTMIGSDNGVKDTIGAVLLGDKRKLTGADGSIVLGAADESTETKVKDATVIGHNANTTVAGGVALGSDSVADRGKADAATVYLNAVDEVKATVKGDLAAVSVGNADATRQITGVAAGTEDTDAVNVAQLKALSTKVDNGTVHYYSVTSDKKAAGSNYNNDGAKAADSMVIGIGSTSEGINSTVIGNNNKLTGNKSIKRAGKVVTVNNSIVAGQNLEVDGYSNTVFATESVYDMYQRQTKVAGDHNTVIGAGNLVRYKEEDDGTYTKLGQDFSSNKNVVIGTRHTVSGSNNVVLGYLTEFELGEDEETKQITTADQVTAIGTGNLIKSKAREGVAIGNHLGINGPQTIAIGFGSEANAQSAISIGQSNTAEGKNAISIGNQSHAYAKNSVAIGGPSVTEGPPAEPGALATVENGVALGAGSVADRKAGMAGYLAGSKTTAEWKSTLGALSVGVVSDEWTATRQITGVAAGTKDTDAVNVAQLKAVESKITQAGAETQKHTSVTAGKNISVSQNSTNAEGGKNYEVSLAKDIDLGQDGSIKAGNTIINKDGVTTNTVKAGDTTINNKGLTIEGGPVITKTYVDVNNQQIHRVKDGTADDDAATVGQVNKKIKEITTTVTGSSVTGGTIGEDGKISLTKGDKTTVELHGQLKDISARAGDYEIKDNKVTIGLEDNYSKNAAGNIVIKDVAKASALEQETKERKDADKVITETIGAANKDELKTSYQNTTYIKNSTTLVEADKALDKAIGKNAGDIKKNTETINILGKQVGNLDTRVNKVGAGAAALAALHPLDFDPDDKWDFAAGYGNYNGANAAAIGAYYRPNEDTMFSVGGSFGGGENMVNAGVSVKLGQGNHVSTSKVAMAKDMLAMQKRMAEMEAQMAKMQGFIGALTGMDTQTAMFPDVPENHWAYEYVKGLCEQGIIEGYPDGNFNGNRSMTRYEFAAMLYRALSKGVSLDARAVKEFAPELGRIRVDVISQNKEGQPVIERVRVNEEKKEK